MADEGCARNRWRFSSTINQKHYASLTEIKEEVEGLAKQGLIEPASKTPNTRKLGCRMSGT